MADSELGLVPEIYYDVIARLCAGAPFVALALWYYPSIRVLPPVGLAIAAAFGSYLVGHLLATVSAVWNPLLWNRWFLGWWARRLHLVNAFGKTSPVASFHEIYRRIDHIASRDANGGAILKKMEAGAQLSDNLFSGYLVIVVANYVIGKQLTRLEVVATVSLGLLLLLTVILRRLILIGRQDSLFSVLPPLIVAQPESTS
jgi:hypothetical protein